jgi:hypothetical protein
MDENRALELWAELKKMVENMEKDVLKNGTKHNVSAGIRVRAGLRAVRRAAVEMGKVSLVADKAVIAERKTKRVNITKTEMENISV